MSLKIDHAIEEIERALAGNKPKYANDIYLNNAVRYLQEIKSPSLTDDQQVVFEWLKEEKEERCSFESAIYWYFEDDVESDIISDRLTQREFLQVLAAFAEWGMKNDQEN